jgi:hypothetical protein
MARIVKQNLPQPPPEYDQAYTAQLARAVNQYMIQRESAGEVIAARFIMTDPPYVGGTPPVTGYPDTKELPTGTLYLKQVPGAPAGTYFLTIVTENDT